MQYKMVHNNLNVLDLDKSLVFYADALNLHEKKRINDPDGNFIIVYLGDGLSSHLLELTWLKDKTDPYDLGDNEFHLAFETDNFNQSMEKHRGMECICYENKAMGIYFIEDPDGYWLEILPRKGEV